MKKSSNKDYQIIETNYYPITTLKIQCTTQIKLEF